MKRTDCIWILILLAAGGCSKQKTVVARIENVEITLEDFQQDFMQSRTVEEILQAGFSDKTEHLDAMMTDEILLQAARELSMEEDPYVRFRIGPLKKYYLVRRFYEMAIVDRFISERDIRDFYKKMRFDVVVDRLAFESKERTTPDVKNALKEEALNAWQSLVEGEAFEFYINGIQSGQIKGRFYRDTLSYSSDKNVIMENAFQLDVDQFSEPIESQRGFHLIRIVDRLPRHVKPLRELRTEIKHELEKKYHSFLYSKYDEMAEALLDKVELKWQEDVIREMCGRFDPYLNLQAALVYRLISFWPEAFLPRILVRYQDKQITVEDFWLRLQTLDDQHRLIIHRQDQLKRFLKNWIKEDLVAETAVENGLDRDPWVVSQLKDSLELAMKQTLLERDIIGIIDTSESKLREFYEKNIEERYTFRERATIQEVLLADSASAAKVLRLAGTGMDFTELVMEYSERKAFRKIKGVIRDIHETDWGPIGTAAFRLQEGEIGGPVAHDEGYSIIKLLEMKPPRAAPYEWVDSVVRKDYIDSIRKERFQAWLDEWKKTHRVERYDKYLLADEESG